MFALISAVCRDKSSSRVLTTDNFRKGLGSLFGVSPLMPPPFHTHLDYSVVRSLSFWLSIMTAACSQRLQGLFLSLVYKWAGTDGLGQIFLPSPLLRGQTGRPKNAALLLGGKKRSIKRGREGKERDGFPRAGEVNTLMFDDSSLRGESLLNLTPSLPGIRNVYSREQTWKSFLSFWGKLQNQLKPL